MSDDLEFSNKDVVPSDDMMSSFFQHNLEIFDADHINNLYHYYVGKDSFFNNDSDDTSSLDGLRKQSDTTNEYNNFCQSYQSAPTSRKNSLGLKRQKIFKTEKTKRKQSTEDPNQDKRLLKQIRNRMAAKKCRENKKHEMKSMMQRLRQAEDELKMYKQLYHDSKVNIF
jgi:hypothetical protein